MDTSIKIRKALESDAERIHQLAIQLDYMPSLEIVKNNLQSMRNQPDYEVVVVTKNDYVVGWMTLHTRRRIEDVPFLQIAAVVTDESVRGQGFGRLLLRYAEDQCQKQGFEFIGLHSSQRRTQSHAFYRNAGYVSIKESLFFKKQME